MDTTHYIGESSIRFEPPDTCFTCLVGDIDAEHMAEIYDAMDWFAEGKEYIFTLNDARYVDTISAPARKLGAERIQKLPVRGMASFGVPFRTRVLIVLYTKLIDTFMRTRDCPLRTFDTEAEARAWLATRREAIAKENAKERH